MALIDLQKIRFNNKDYWIDFEGNIDFAKMSEVDRAIFFIIDLVNMCESGSDLNELPSKIRKMLKSIYRRYVMKGIINNLEVNKLKAELNALPRSSKEEILEIINLLTPGTVESIIKVLFNLYIEDPSLTERFKKHAVIGAVKSMLSSQEFDEIVKFLKDE